MNTNFSSLATPILFMVFNRLDTTKEVFRQIERVKPQKLYLAADGARDHVPDEGAKVKNVRSYLLNNITWECDVKTYFRDQNNGCRKACIDAIDWFFSHEEMGIILEDDCFPTVSFFYFCQELLKRYKNTYKIWHINGNNYNLNKRHLKYDYGFCNYPQVWGWATWKRAWLNYDSNLDGFDANTIYPFKKKLGWSDKEYKIEQKKWILVKQSKIDTWDYQWHFSVFSNSGLCIVPRENQISNIGFSDKATHTKSFDRHRAGLKTGELSFPLRHPQTLSVNKKVNRTFKHMMIKKTFFQMAPTFLNRILLKSMKTICPSG